MSETIETPRTDAHYHQRDPWKCDLEFARQLERELASETEKVIALKEEAYRLNARLTDTLQKLTKAETLLAAEKAAREIAEGKVSELDFIRRTEKEQAQECERELEIRSGTIKGLDESIAKLTKELSEEKAALRSALEVELKRCPVCDGRRTVLHGTWDGKGRTEECQRCKAVSDALSSPPPPVVPQATHNRLRELAEGMAEALKYHVDGGGKPIAGHAALAAYRAEFPEEGKA